MTVLADTLEPASVSAAGARSPRFTAETATEWAEVAHSWSGEATPFQDATWFESWYEAMRGRAGLTPLIVTIRGEESCAVAMRLPLVLRRRGRLRVVEFADLELTDYNAPLLGPAASTDPEHARLMWRALQRALPPADLLRFTKMPEALRGRPNPLALLPGALPCALNGNIVVTGEDWDAWRRSLEKTVRKELERSWRVFTREPGAAFEIVTDPVRAQAIVDAMEHQQETRMRVKGADYALDDPDFARFYRMLIARGLSSGYALVTALTVGEEVVASLLGIRDGDSYLMIRISNAGGRWTNCSPGRLIIERTMAALHEQGYRKFDFSIGNYDYKRRFGVAPVPLVDLTRALSPFGLPAALRATAAGQLRKHPDWDHRARSLMARMSRG